MCTKIVYSPVNGNVITTNKIKDDVFGSNTLGEGFGIIPKDGKFVAPIAGEVTLCEGHAFSIKSNDNVEVLVHIGIETVSIKPEDKAQIFKYSCKVGDKVNIKDHIGEVDIEKIKQLGFDITTPVIVLKNPEKSRSIMIEHIGESLAGDSILSIE